MIDACALHAIEEQTASCTPLERMRVVAGILLDILPRGRTFVLCDECERAIRGAEGGTIHSVSDKS